MRRLHQHWIAAALALLVPGAFLLLRAIDGPANDFRFSILGDRTGGAQPQIYGRIWREVDLLHPDFVINVGDTIEGGKDDAAETEWQGLRPLFERYSHYPLYFTPGNHDVWSPKSQEIYSQQTGRPTFYSFNYQDAHFTVLDNSRTLELSNEQLEFLDKDLEANKVRRPKFVFFHKPYWILPIKLKSGEFALHQIAKRHGVEYIISGHGHQFVRSVYDGIAYMEVGSSGGNMTRGLRRGEGFPQGWFYHHVWVRVKGAKTAITVKELDGPFGEGRMFKAEEWNENGPQFNLGDPALSIKPET